MSSTTEHATKAALVPRSAIEIRNARRRTLVRRYAIFVGLPTLLAVVYFLLVAVPQYDARMSLAVESSEGRATADGRGKESNAGNQRDARLLRERLTSATTIETIDTGDVLRTHYRDNGDFIARLDKDATAEELRAYVREHIVVVGDATTNILSVRARAFAPATALHIAEQLRIAADAWALEQNRTSRDALLGPAQTEVDHARDRLVEARKAAQAALGTTDPTGAQKTDLRAIDLELATRGLELALTSLQQAQLAAARGDRVIVVLDPPRLPELAARPKPAWGIATVFIVSIVLVSVLSLLGAAVREHANF